MSRTAESQDFAIAARNFAPREAPTTALFNEMLATAWRGEPMREAVPIACLRQLIAARAWTDAALALIALKAPQWKLRSLRYDGGEWHCALSRQREMPEFLDHGAEAHHSHMAMAILRALDEINADPLPHLGSVPAVSAPAQRFEPMLVDNFA
jgi:hypothetical protein